MAIADTVTAGFGEFSSAVKIVTRGFSIGEEVPTTFPGAVQVAKLGPGAVEFTVLGPGSVELHKTS
jgi:hypothetical protein